MGFDIWFHSQLQTTLIAFSVQEIDQRLKIHMLWAGDDSQLVEHLPSTHKSPVSYKLGMVPQPCDPRMSRKKDQKSEVIL